jgi:hypothetical protein
MAGCSGKCDGIRGCPALLYGEIDSPDGGSISAVSADSPCKAFPQTIEPGVYAVSTDAPIPDGQTRSCRVHAVLSSGVAVEGVVTFQGVGCCGNTAVGGPVTLRVVDGGASD